MPIKTHPPSHPHTSGLLLQEIRGTLWEGDPFFRNGSYVRSFMPMAGAWSDVVRILLLHKYGDFWMDNDVVLYTGARCAAGGMAAVAAAPYGDAWLPASYQAAGSATALSKGRHKTARLLAHRVPAAKRCLPPVARLKQHGSCHASICLMCWYYTP